MSGKDETKDRFIRKTLMFGTYKIDILSNSLILFSRDRPVPAIVPHDRVGLYTGPFHVLGPRDDWVYLTSEEFQAIPIHLMRYPHFLAQDVSILGIGLDPMPPDFERGRDRLLFTPDRHTVPLLTTFIKYVASRRHFRLVQQNLVLSMALKDQDKPPQDSKNHKSIQLKDLGKDNTLMISSALCRSRTSATV